MTKLERLLELYGLRVRFADLGDWGDAELRSEYDPAIPEIRVHFKLHGDLIPRAIAHELYHHCEAIGEIATLRGRAARERAADTYAREVTREI